MYTVSDPWQWNFIDACPFSSNYMFPTIWSCTTTIGLLEFYIRVRLKVTYVWRKIQEAQSNYLLRTAHLLIHLDMPLHGNNARGAKYVVYYASVVTHTVFENIKWLHSALCQNKKGPVDSLVYSLTVCSKIRHWCHFHLNMGQRIKFQACFYSD